MENSYDPTLEEPEFTITAEELLASLEIGNISLVDGNSTDSDTLDDQRFNYIAQGQTSDPSDWNFGIGGLLPPLKRPDPNQIPADVFSYLMKAGRLSEVMQFPEFAAYPLEIQAQADINHHSTQPVPNWQVQNNTQFLTCNHSNWSPNSLLPVASSSSSPNSHNNPQLRPGNATPPRQQNSFQFNLSPHAEEFVPGRYTPIRVQENANILLSRAIDEVKIQQEQHYQHHQQHNPRFSPRQQNPQYQQQPFTTYSTPPFYQGQRGGGGYRQQRPNFPPRQQSSPRQRGYRPSYYSSSSVQSEPLPESVSDRILTCVTDTITHLSTNPADFHACVKRTIRVLKELLVDPDILEIIITLIVEQSVANKNFSYTGAKLCQALNENNIRVGDFTTQHCVFTHVQTVFTSSLTSINTTSNELRERHIGLLFFLAELFVNFKIDNGVSFFGFGVAAVEIMSQLIQYDKGVVGPSHENIKSVVNVLKLSGWELEQNKNAKLKEDVEKLMKDLTYIHTVEDKALPLTKELIGKVFELKNINWGRGEDENPTARAETPPPTTTYNGKSEDILYEPPPSSDDDEVYLDDESDEVNKFYEQFLNTLPSSQGKH